MKVNDEILSFVHLELVSCDNANDWLLFLFLF